MRRVSIAGGQWGMHHACVAMTILFFKKQFSDEMQRT